VATSTASTGVPSGSGRAKGNREEARLRGWVDGGHIAEMAKEIGVCPAQYAVVAVKTISIHRLCHRPNRLQAFPLSSSTGFGNFQRTISALSSL
jgi:hypothetical protein